MTATRPATAPSTTLTVSSGEPLSADLTARLTRCCEEAEDGRTAPAVTIRLTAPEPDRRAGAHWPGEVTSAAVNRWERAVRRLERLPVATVAVVEGDCRGPALEVLLATDYRLGRDGATIAFPSIGDRPWPGTALYRLTQQLGVGRARSAVLFGVDLPMRRALEWGLIDELFESDGTAVASAMIERLAPEQGRELAIRRRLMFDAAATGFEHALGAHLAACDRELRRERPAEGSGR